MCLLTVKSFMCNTIIRINKKKQMIVYRNLMLFKKNVTNTFWWVLQRTRGDTKHEVCDWEHQCHTCFKSSMLLFFRYMTHRKEMPFYYIQRLEVRFPNQNNWRSDFHYTLQILPDKSQCESLTHWILLNIFLAHVGVDESTRSYRTW